jgi:phenol hydroxylase P0 protein
METMEASNAGADTLGREDGCVKMGGDGAFARVLGIRLDRFVEFEYSLDDGLLAVELILPLVAFHEFCRAQNATILPSAEQEKASDLERLAWREKQPGMLRRPIRGDGPNLGEE